MKKRIGRVRDRGACDVALRLVVLVAVGDAVVTSLSLGSSPSAVGNSFNVAVSRLCVCVCVCPTFLISSDQVTPLFSSPVIKPDNPFH